MFGIEAFSFKKLPTLDVFGEQLKIALNDKDKLGIIYGGLTYYILAKHGGAKNIPRIKHHDHNQSPTTRTIYLIKVASGAHLRSKIEKFPLEATTLEKKMA